MAIYFCTTAAEVQAALNVVVAGDIVRLDRTQTFTTTGQNGLILRNRGVIPANNPIYIEGDASLGDLPADGYRITPSYSAVLPKLQATQASVNQNDQVFTTDNGANGYVLRFLEIGPSYLGSHHQVVLGLSTQTAYSDVPFNITFDRCYFRGHPLSGQRGGINVHANAVVVKNCYFQDYKGFGQDACPITGGNFDGSLTVENNYLEGAGYCFILGGEDIVLGRHVATVAAAPAPTTTQATLSSVEELAIGQVVAILCGATRRHPRVTAITGPRITFEAIDQVPTVPGDVRWGANPSGLTFRRNYAAKPVAWRDPILHPAPIASDALITPAGSGVSPGTYYMRVQALHDSIGYQGNTYYSETSNELTYVVTQTSELSVQWSSVTNATKYRIYRYQKDGGGAITNGRYHLINATTLAFTDTNQAGTSFSNIAGASRWTVKNHFELKVCNNALVTQNIFERTWEMGAGKFSSWLKVNNQDGAHEFAQVDNLLIEWNRITGTVGAFDCSGQRATGEGSQDLPKKPTNWLIRQNLVYDSNPSWINPGISVSSYGLGHSGATDNLTYDHNTFVHTNGSGAALFGHNTAKYGFYTNLRLTNNLMIRNAFGIFVDDGFGEGTGGLTAISNSTLTFDKNVIADAPAGSYGVGSNFFPTQTTFEAQFKQYGSVFGGGDDYRLKRLSEGDGIDSLYLNAGTDGADIGCDVAQLNTKLAGVVAGTPESSPDPTSVQVPAPRFSRGARKPRTRRAV